MTDSTEQQDRRLPGREDAESWLTDYGRWRHVVPLPNRRMMLHVGAETVENFFVVGDAWAQIVARYLGDEASVLDVGCGCGRTARFLMYCAQIRRYVGLDVIRPYVDWCNRFLAGAHPGKMEFLHLDVRTPRYNPEGAMAATEARFPVADAGVDLAFAASLFTHLPPEAAQRYLAEISRCLRPGGLVIASIHDRPDHNEFSGDEFRADYSPDFFLRLCAGQGLELTEELGEVCGQLTFVLNKGLQAT